MSSPNPVAPGRTPVTWNIHVDFAGHPDAESIITRAAADLCELLDADGDGFRVFLTAEDVPLRPNGAKRQIAAWENEPEAKFDSTCKHCHQGIDLHGGEAWVIPVDGMPVETCSANPAGHEPTNTEV